METRNPSLDWAGAGLGETQRRLLELLKRDGECPVAELADRLELAPETVRSHLQALAGRGLVRRTGTRRGGPGRPEILYGLAERAETLFPTEEGRLLGDLTRYLVEEGHGALLEAFFERRVRDLREEAGRRLEGLRGEARLEEVAEILSEQGFMAEPLGAAPGSGTGCGGEDLPGLRLCHCPLKAMVAVTTLPCRAEERWIEALTGGGLERVSWMPDGDRTCSYRIRPPRDAEGAAPAEGAPPG